MRHNFLGVLGLTAKLGISHYNGVTVGIFEIESIEIALVGNYANERGHLSHMPTLGAT